jgi:hypothetical protein
MVGLLSGRAAVVIGARGAQGRAEDIGLSACAAWTTWCIIKR